MRQLFYLAIAFVLTACGTSSPNYEDLIHISQAPNTDAYISKDINYVASQSDRNYENWRYINKVSSTTFEIESYMFTRSIQGRNTYGRRIVLGVSCDGKDYSGNPEFDVYIRTDQVMNDIIAIRFNDSSPQTAYGDVWTSYDGITLSGSTGYEIINESREKSDLYVRLDMYSDSDIEARFSLVGFNEAFRRVYRDCWIAANS